jgi:hypothetical protein
MGSLRFLWRLGGDYVQGYRAHISDPGAPRNRYRDAGPTSKQKACGVYATKGRDGSLSVDIVGAVASSN